MVNYSWFIRKLTVVKTAVSIHFYFSSLNMYVLPAFANNISVQNSFSCWLWSFSINVCVYVCVQDTNRCPAPPPPPAAVTAPPASTVCLWSWRASHPTTPPPSSATWPQSTDPSRRHWHREDDTIWQVIDGDLSQCELKMTPSLSSAPREVYSRKHFSRLLVETSCKQLWLHVVTAMWVNSAKDEVQVHVGDFALGETCQWSDNCAPEVSEVTEFSWGGKFGDKSVSEVTVGQISQWSVFKN